MAKTVEFTVKNSKPFTSFMKKFASIDNTVLFEADFANSKFVAKSTNEERSVVKYGELSFSEAEFEGAKEKARIKIGIYSIPRLIKIIEQFAGEFKFVIKYDEIMNNNEKDFAATSILLKDDELKFNIECTSLNIFKYISDDVWNNTIKKIDQVISFEFSKENIEKIRALSELDKEYKLVEMVNKEGNMYVRGKSFEYLLVPTSTNADMAITFFKEQFNKIDIENLTVTMGLDRSLFSSNDTTTDIVIARAEGNDNYDDSDDLPF